ncbi:MAG: hypothetical protein SOV37_01410 [Candidatus Borkfalkiaceae bacterium]|nr:hypothetical protein [Christensenellaceae bacterium]
MSKVKSKLLVALTLAFCVCLSVFAFGKITVRADEQAVESTVTMLGGASIRLDENSGIKFTAKISGYNADDVSTSYGMIIMPYDFVGKYITDDTAYHANLNAKGVKYLDRICTPFEYNGEYFINYTMVDIKYSNYTREFIGVAYKKVGGEYTYATTNKANNVRSVAQVALLAKEDTDKFNDYTDEQKAVIEKFITYSSVVGETVISDDFASGSLSGWDSYSAAANRHLTVNGKNGQIAIKTKQSFTDITEISYDLKVNVDGMWTGLTFADAYSALYLCRATGFDCNVVSGTSKNVACLGEWYTLKYEITSETTGAFFVAKRGETLEKVGDFTYTVSGGSLKSGQIAFSTANVAEPSFDIDNFVVKHSGGTTTETFDSANSIADTVFSKVSATSVEVYNPASTGKLLLNTGRYIKKLNSSLSPENSFIRTTGYYTNLKSYSVNIKITSGVSGWSGISLNEKSLYGSPLYVYKNQITPMNSTLYSVSGEEVQSIAVDLTEWKIFKIVPVEVMSDGSEKAEIFVGVPNGTLTKIGYYIVSANKITSCPVSSGSPTFINHNTANGEIGIACFSVSYEDDNGEIKTITEYFDEDYQIVAGRYHFNYVHTTNYEEGEFCLAEFDSATDYALTGNIVAKDAVAGGNGMTEDSAIIGVYKVKYIKGSGKFDITFNYGGNGVYGERIAIENGKLTYYTGETAGTVKEFTAEDGAEITLEIRLYKSGAISVKVNDENGVTTLRDSGEFGSFAIFATDGITKVTSVKATQYHIPE